MERRSRGNPSSGNPQIVKDKSKFEWELLSSSPRLDLLFKNLSVFGTAALSNRQETAASLLEKPFRYIFGIRQGRRRRLILNGLCGYVKCGELVAIIGRPGSGCSTFLKTVAGELNGLVLGEDAILTFNGIPRRDTARLLKGEINYNPELDKHFPHLTVEQTLHFAAALSVTNNRLDNVTREDCALSSVEDIISAYSLGHATHTKVGNEFVRGVSGGERRKVSIAEMALTGCAVSCWDQSTRGLDSSSALSLVMSSKMLANEGSSHIMSLYQTSDVVLREFDKVMILYEGRQVFFGRPQRAGQYFEDMGWQRSPRQPIGDFLAAVTNPEERSAEDGYEERVPRTTEEFEKHWHESEDYRQLQLEMSNLEAAFESKEQALVSLKQSLHSRKSPHTFRDAPYITGSFTQIKYCTIRMVQRIWNDRTSTLAITWGQIVMSLILGSLFYQTPNNVNGLFSKGGVLFGSIMLNAVVTVTEIFQLYSNRPIIEKQASYAMYRPWTDAFASLVVNVPLKLVIASTFNIILYFLAGLRRTAANFFIFFLFCYIIALVMSSVFRTIGASTKAIPQAFVVVGVVLPLLIIYTGFVIPKPSMHVWFKWLTFINPVGYAFESLIANEFHDQNFACTTTRTVPPYAGLVNGSFVCAVRGSVENEAFVSGDAYIRLNYDYIYGHIWRNLGILFGFLLFFIIVYLVISDRNMKSPPTLDELIFRRGHVPKSFLHSREESEVPSVSYTAIEENVERSPRLGLLEHTRTFSWQSICYDIPIKGGTRRLLADVSGWVKPGTLTALMGVSGAGKTTLLDMLAKRSGSGIVIGKILLDGHKLPPDFERSTGYVQQQDLHVETTTVREALRFSAMMRQARAISRQEKFAYVEQVIDMLGMSDFAEAVVGVPGHGLSTRQRKLLSIGVELAARPSILLFLDEPTTGLDSQSAFGVISFLRMLADSGTTILCTIHQPSAMLFQQFNRLLLLVQGGRIAYFGPIGENSQTVIAYFRVNGGRPCQDEENPAEYIIEIASHSSVDWPEVWKSSNEGKTVAMELNDLGRPTEAAKREEQSSENVLEHRSQTPREFALPFYQQLYHVTIRVYQQYWRTPEYVWSKILLAVVSSLFIGFTFYKMDSSIQGIQNTMFAIFMQAAIFPPLVNQIMPKFVSNRSLYEVRERPSKAYSWAAFLLAQILAELPYQIIMGSIVFAIWNYTVLGIQSPSHQGLVLLFLIQFFVWGSTFAQAVVAALPNAETAAMLSIVFFLLSALFSGVLQPPTAMPHFWKFLWRVSPLTYWIAGIVGTGLHGREVVCAQAELSVFDPPRGTTCAQYLELFFQMHAPGYLLNPQGTSACEYCPWSLADQVLEQAGIEWSQRWRNFGLGMAYIAFNVAMTVVLYYLFRLGTLARWVSRLRGRR